MVSHSSAVLRAFILRVPGTQRVYLLPSGEQVTIPQAPDCLLEMAAWPHGAEQHRVQQVFWRLIVSFVLESLKRLHDFLLLVEW